MMHYRKGENVEQEFRREDLPFEDCFPNGLSDFLWMHVKGGTKVNNVVTYAKNALDKGEHRTIVWTGAGGGVVKAISCAEIMKRSYALYQVTRMCYQTIEEHWQPQMDGLDAIIVNRQVPCLHILMSLDTIDDGISGLQKPNSVTEFWSHNNDSSANQRRSNSNRNQNNSNNNRNNNQHQNRKQRQRQQNNDATNAASGHGNNTQHQQQAEKQPPPKQRQKRPESEHQQQVEQQQQRRFSNSKFNQKKSSPDNHQHHQSKSTTNENGAFSKSIQTPPDTSNREQTKNAAETKTNVKEPTLPSAV